MPRCLSTSACSGPAGIDSRTSMETALPLPACAGWPRPSLMWQFWQALVLRSGPRPSRAVVEAGAMTQGFLKKLLPTLKSSRRTGERLADGMEKAFWSNFITVALPAESASPGSACSKCGVCSSQATRPSARSRAAVERKSGCIGRSWALKAGILAAHSNLNKRDLHLSGVGELGLLVELVRQERQKGRHCAALPDAG